MPQPFCRSYLKILTPELRARAGVAVMPWRLDDLCKSYKWPSGLAGGGKLAIVSLGGGYYPSDIAKFFSRLKLPQPSLTSVAVDAGASNHPGDPADVENHLDIMMAGGAYSIATGKPAQIRIYWAANDLGAITRAITRAGGDGCDVCSISWGADEAAFGSTVAMQMEAAATVVTTNGMIVCAASGDNDSSDGGPGASNVDLPAACPHVIGCGGTMRPHDSTGLPETVWNDNPGNANGQGTGGGPSKIWQRPTWQVNAPGSMRSVPDVAANADPTTGIHILYQGQDMVVGGTSMVAPLYAGLFAAFGAKRGFVAPLLWSNQVAFRDITSGDNGAYRAATGPDFCTGLGSPIASRLATLFAR